MENENSAQLFANRFIGCRLNKGWSQQKCADNIGVALRSVQSWEQGENIPQPNNLRKISAVFGVSVEFLRNGSDLEITETPPLKGNASLPSMAVQELPRRVPVVSWAAAGYGGVYHDLAEQIGEQLNTDCLDPNAYALIIEGDSMEPEFKSGDRVIFMPNTEATNGDVVVARLEEQGQVFFKLFHTFGKSAEMVRLTSYNAAYPPLEFHRSEFRFIHPMHSMVRRRKK